MLDFLLKLLTNDPSRSWSRQSGVKLVFDMDCCSLNGVTLGSKASRLEFLGPGESWSIRNARECCYFSKGLAFNYDRNEILDCFEFVFNCPQNERYSQCVVEFWYGENIVDLAALPLEEVVQVFGPYFWKDSDDDEVLLFYEFGNIEWQMEFGSQRKLDRLIVTSDPIMADAAQREVYGVPKEVSDNLPQDGESVP